MLPQALSAGSGALSGAERLTEGCPTLQAPRTDLLCRNLPPTITVTPDGPKGRAGAQREGARYCSRKHPACGPWVPALRFAAADNLDANANRVVNVIR